MSNEIVNVVQQQARGVLHLQCDASERFAQNSRTFCCVAQSRASRRTTTPTTTSKYAATINARSVFVSDFRRSNDECTRAILMIGVCAERRRAAADDVARHEAQQVGRRRFVVAFFFVICFRLIVCRFARFVRSFVANVSATRYTRARSVRNCES
jgi:hypothetical protein